MRTSYDHLDNEQLTAELRLRNINPAKTVADQRRQLVKSDTSAALARQAIQDSEAAAATVMATEQDTFAGEPSEISHDPNPTLAQSGRGHWRRFRVPFAFKVILGLIAAAYTTIYLLGYLIRVGIDLFSDDWILIIINQWSQALVLVLIMFSTSYLLWISFSGQTRARLTQLTSCILASLLVHSFVTALTSRFNWLVQGVDQLLYSRIRNLESSGEVDGPKLELESEGKSENGQHGARSADYAASLDALATLVWSEQQKIRAFFTQSVGEAKPMDVEPSDGGDDDSEYGGEALSALDPGLKMLEDSLGALQELFAGLEGIRERFTDPQQNGPFSVPPEPSHSHLEESSPKPEDGGEETLPSRVPATQLFTQQVTRQLNKLRRERNRSQRQSDRLRQKLHELRLGMEVQAKIVELTKAEAVRTLDQGRTDLFAELKRKDEQIGCQADEIKEKNRVAEERDSLLTQRDRTIATAVQSIVQSRLILGGAAPQSDQPMLTWQIERLLRMVQLYRDQESRLFWQRPNFWSLARIRGGEGAQNNSKEEEYVSVSQSRPDVVEAKDYNASGSGVRSLQSYEFMTVLGPEMRTDHLTPDLSTLMRGWDHGVGGAVILDGQSGSGKTHTMLSANSSILSWVISYIADRVQHPPGQDCEHTIAYAVTEFRNKRSFDLVEGLPGAGNKAVDLVLAGDTKKVANLYITKDVTTLPDILRRACARRQVAKTDKNETSSRSHLVISFCVRENGEEDKLLPLHLIDLAGAEHGGGQAPESSLLPIAKRAPARAQHHGREDDVFSYIRESRRALGTWLRNRNLHQTQGDLLCNFLHQTLEPKRGPSFRIMFISCLRPLRQDHGLTKATLDYAQEFAGKRSAVIKIKSESNLRGRSPGRDVSR